MIDRVLDSRDGDVSNSIATVLLLIDSDRNRELLADQLGKAFEVHGDGGEVPASDFDLCILDDRSLGTYEDELRQAKAAASPTFRPHLLLAGKRSPDEFPQEVWTVVDEVIRRPVSKAELDARIDNLLQRRRLSLELTRAKERSERRFESLFASTPDPVVVVTPDGTVTEVNDAFARIFGVDPEQIQERPITDLEITPAESVERVLLRIADDEPASTTVEWMHDEDDHLVMELNADVITGLGEATERIGIFRDVTEQTRHRQELERQNERLEEFAHTIAHDLRNPLSVARGRLDLAQDGGEEEHFAAVDQAHERMEQMIEELLSLARQGHAVLDPDPVRLVDVTEAAWGHVETADASLEVDVDRSVVITADEGRLCELLENLFRNSVEHGGEAVTVRVGLLTEGTGFYVEDDGPGIPREKREEIFEAGYTDAADGTGFGLSIVWQIVDGHEWGISVTDGVVGGARFEVTGVDVV